MSSPSQRQIVLVSGTSRGLGLALRDALEARGHTVYGSSRRPSGAAPRELALDVTDPASCEQAVRTILEREGRLDGIVNNAGSHLHGAAVETSEDELRQQMELNFHGAVALTRAALPSMLAQRAGRIVNVSSVGGRFATPFTSAYSASKFALEGYMEALRLELLPFGVFVSNLEPGFLRTGTTEQSIVSVRSGHPLYEHARAATRAEMLEAGAHGLPLERVVRVVASILEDPAPAFRHSVDGLAPKLSLLRALAPARWFERMVVAQTAPAFARAGAAALPGGSTVGALAGDR
jgi:NAD(P)-dependent dehydrogenase (short-subunit alcohol dehydrogenase family)